MLVVDKDFIKQRIKVDNNGCWIWQKALQTHGYSYIPHAYAKRWKTRIGHRISYIIHIGAIPEGLEVDHTCNTPACVNPDHLEAVTHEENNRRRDERFIAANPFFTCGHARLETGRWRQSGYQGDTGKPKRAFYCKPCLMETNKRRRHAATNNLH